MNKQYVIKDSSIDLNDREAAIFFMNYLSQEGCTASVTGTRVYADLDIDGLVFMHKRWRDSFRLG